MTVRAEARSAARAETWRALVSRCHYMESVLFFYSVIFIHKIDIIRNVYVVWLQISSAILLLYIIIKRLAKQTKAERCLGYQ